MSYEALYCLEIHGFRTRVLKNTRVYEMVKELTSCAYPEKLYRVWRIQHSWSYSEKRIKDPTQGLLLEGLSRERG